MNKQQIEQAVKQVLDKEGHPLETAYNYEVANGEKVYFLEPLEKVISIKELQKIMDTAEELVNKLREGKI